MFILIIEFMIYMVWLSLKYSINKNYYIVDIFIFLVVGLYVMKVLLFVKELGLKYVIFM